VGNDEQDARKSPEPAALPDPDVVARRIDNGAVLINLRTNRIYELNTTGTRIWELLGEGGDRAAIVEQLLQEFDVEADAAAQAVDDTVEQLQREGLLRERGGN
jgi:hypothetical protein